MKPAMLCLLLLSACSDLTTEYGYRAYRLTWRCDTPEGCERTEQVVLHDRVEIGKGSDVIEFRSTRDEYYYEFAQMVSSDTLPAECSLVYGLTMFVHELEPARFCRTSGGFELGTLDTQSRSLDSKHVPGGCERTEELEQIDRMELARRNFHFTSTQDESFSEHAQQIASDALPPRCYWLYDFSLLGHDLEPSRLCFIAGGFELEFAIPNEDPVTQSLWLVEGLDVDLL